MNLNLGWRHLIALVIILGMVWAIRQVVDGGFNPMEQLPSVDINR